jgi:hypothetical protein
MRRFALFAAALALAACDRVPLDPGDVRVEVVSPDLGVAQSSGLMTLDLRVSSATPGSSVTVNGQEATFSDARGLYSVAVGLVPGLNALAVEATSNEAVVLRDTVYALRLDVRADTSPTIPQRAGHSTTPLPDGSTLIIGGDDGTAADDAVVRWLPTGGFTTRQLAIARAGHSASVLPSGEILLLGGATTLLPTQSGQFVATAELLPADGAAPGTVIPIEGGGFLRTGHTTRVLTTAGGQTLLYVYGGRDASAVGVDPTGTVAILEWLPEGRLVRLSPPLGAGAFPPAEFHAQLDLPGLRSVVLDGAPPDGSAAVYSWSEPGVNFPFDMRRAEAPPLPTPRAAAAVAPIGPGLWVVAGGRTPDGDVSGAVEVYAPAIQRAFRLGVTLAVPRAHASAAILDGPRIAIVGGLDAAGELVGAANAFRY